VTELCEDCGRRERLPGRAWCAECLEIRQDRIVNDDYEDGDDDGEQ
jgi:uncharacterized OB-fold protein